tara:strand:+ start:2174 stop:2845 length:672 start_codon:yes stop_codon:yes gene_type:complete
MINSVLFFGRKNCKFSLKIESFLKKKIKLVDIIFSENKKKINISKFQKKKYDYIFCFRSKIILRNNILKTSKFSINFHPSLPKYRGVGGVNYAIYNNDKYFGFTVHIINKKIDNGKILFVDKFKIRKNESVDSLLNRTHKKMFNKFIQIIKKIYKDKNFIKILLKKENKYRWSKKYYDNKDLDKFYEIKITESSNEIKKKIKSTTTNMFKPYVKLNKKRLYIT